LVFSESLELIDNEDLTLSNFPPLFPNAYLKSSRHFLDVLTICAENSVPMAGVVSDELIYEGAVLLQDVAMLMANSYAIQKHGAVLVLSIPERDYSLAVVSRLIEVDNVKIIYSFVEADPEDIAKVLVTLKINQTDVSRTIATLERYNYVIAQKFHESNFPEWEKERLDSFMRFLNV
jgi:hypothetical protein